MEFKYQIGEVVASSLHLDELRRFMDATPTQIRPDTMYIEERISIECAGGTQLFYSCRMRDGRVEKHPEAILVAAEVLWTTWLTGLEKQEAKKVQP